METLTAIAILFAEITSSVLLWETNIWLSILWIVILCFQLISAVRAYAIKKLLEEMIKKK